MQGSGIVTGIHRRDAAAAEMVAPRATTRVLLVGPLPPPVHGCSVFTRLLLESRFTAEFDVTHVDITDARDVGNIGRFDAGNVWLALRHGAAFTAALFRVRPDVIYIPVAQNTLGFLRDMLFLMPAAFSGRRMIVHFHGDGFAAFRESAAAPLRAAAGALTGRARVAIVQGEGLVPMLQGIIPRDRIAVVPNGVPDPGAPQRGGGTGVSATQILFLSNLAPAKGYIDLVEAALRLLRSGVDAEFVFAGSVADDAAFKRARGLVSEYAERIRFVGHADAERKAALLKHADVLVLPSYSEAQPLVVLEAMAAGLPVVSTKRGAIPETVPDGVTGLLVEPGDIVALEAALRRLITDPVLRMKLGAAGRERYLERYTVDHWVDAMIRVVRSVADHE